MAAPDRIDYPNQYTAPFQLRDCREVIIRPIRPDDEPPIVALHAEHSPHTIRMRFFDRQAKLAGPPLARSDSYERRDNDV